MRIPTPIKQLNVANTSLCQASSQQAIVGKGRLAGWHTISLLRFLRLLSDIHGLWHSHLHTERHLVLGRPGQRLRITKGIMIDLVQLLQSI